MALFLPPFTSSTTAIIPDSDNHPSVSTSPIPLNTNNNGIGSSTSVFVSSVRPSGDRVAGAAVRGRGPSHTPSNGYEYADEYIYGVSIDPERLRIRLEALRAMMLLKPTLYRGSVSDPESYRRTKTEDLVPRSSL
jgi:hypothetical protein